MCVGDLAQVIDRPRRVDLGRPEKPSTAAHLVLGNKEKAQADLAMLDTLKTRTWAQNIPALQTAVAANDRSFTYDPSDSPPPFDIFPPPQ